MIGTIMAGNVFFNIIPAHWELINAKKAGRDPDPFPGVVAKQRSVHNNYFTLPVLFTMIAGHFAFTYGVERAWIVLLVIMFVGILSRLFFNLRHQGRTIWAIPVVCVVVLVALGVAIRPDTTPAGTGIATVSFSEVAPIVEQRCAACHSQAPTQPGFSTAPAGRRARHARADRRPRRRHRAGRVVEGDAARQRHRHDGRGASGAPCVGRAGRLDRGM